MNISNLLAELESEIKKTACRNKSSKQENTKEIEKEIKKIQNKIVLINRKVEQIEKCKDKIQQKNMEADFKKILKLAKAHSISFEKKVMTIRMAMDKAIVKYKVKDKRPEKSMYNHLDIRYEAKSNSYYVNNNLTIHNPPIISRESDKYIYIKSLLENKEDINRIFDVNSKIRKKVLKNCDPFIIGILAQKDVELACKYVRELAEPEKVEKENMPFNITYDLREINEIPKQELTFWEKHKIKKMAHCKNGASEVLENKKRLPWYTTMPIVGALALGTVGGGVAIFNNNLDRNEDLSSNNNSYSDSLEPGSDEDKELEESIITSCSTENYTNATTTICSSNNKSNTTTTTTKPIEDTKRESIKINIGDGIKVEDGLKYTATCLGEGDSNKIGAVSWRPSAEYAIDRVAFCYCGKVLGIMDKGQGDVRQVLNDYATKYGIDESDIDTSVLLSLIPGNGDTGWASISIEDMEKNVRKQEKNVNSTIIRKEKVSVEFERE